MLFFLGGHGLLVYLVLWLIMPFEAQSGSSTTSKPAAPEQSPQGEQ